MQDGAADGGTRPRGAGRWLKLALVASLALNLVVIGAMVSRWAGYHRDHGHRHWRHSDARHMPPGMRLYAQAMPEPARERLRAEVAARKETWTKRRAALRAHVDEMVRTLRAEPFDAARLAELMAAQHAAMAGMIGEGQQLMVGQIAAMNPGDRSLFADRLERMLAERRR